MKKSELEKIIKSELDLFLPRGRKGSFQNMMRLRYSYYRRMDLADGSPEGPERILKKCRNFGFNNKETGPEMLEKSKKCDECGETLKPSQYVKLKREEGSSVKADEDLVYRNYPNCLTAEKEKDRCKFCGSTREIIIAIEKDDNGEKRASGYMCLECAPRSKK